MYIYCQFICLFELSLDLHNIKLGSVLTGQISKLRFSWTLVVNQYTSSLHVTNLQYLSLFFSNHG